MQSEQGFKPYCLLYNKIVKFCVFSLVLFIFSCDVDPYGQYNRNANQQAPYVSPVRSRVPQQQYYQQPQPYYYGTPNSRSYRNPYEFQQPYGRNPYSDYDQYYVPPTQYYNNEYDQGTSSSSVFDNVQ